MITSATISPDGRLALSGDYSGRLTYWDLQNGLPPWDLAAIESLASGIDCIAISPDGRFILAGDAKE